MVSNSYNIFTKSLIAVAMSVVLMFGFTSHAAGLKSDSYAGEETGKESGVFKVSKNLVNLTEKELKHIQEDTKAAEEAFLAAVKAEEERLAMEAAAAAEAERLAAEEAARQAAAAETIVWRQEEAVAVSYSEQELLAALIYCEAGNQPYEGQVAVGAVVMNRIRSGSYPNSMTEVIYQSGQFGPAMTGWLDRVLANGGYTDAARQAAADALAGSNPIGDCLYFGCGNYGTKIGDHWFH